MCVALVGEARGTEAQQVLEGVWDPPSSEADLIAPPLDSLVWCGGQASFHAGGELLLFYRVQMALRLSSRSWLV